MLKGQAKTNYQRNYMRQRRLDPAIQASERRSSTVRRKGNGHNTGICEICSYSETTDTHHEGIDRIEHTLCPNHHALITRGLTTLLDLTQSSVRPSVQPKTPDAASPVTSTAPVTWLDADGNMVYDTQ